jgi:hypothetical protein
MRRRLSNRLLVNAWTTPKRRLADRSQVLVHLAANRSWLTVDRGPRSHGRSRAFFFLALPSVPSLAPGRGTPNSRFAPYPQPPQTSRITKQWKWDLFFVAVAWNREIENKMLRWKRRRKRGVVEFGKLVSRLFGMKPAVASCFPF